MLRTWLRRWLGVEQAAVSNDSAFSPLERRLNELEDRLDFVHGSLRKLRGRVTGGLRGDPAPDGGDGVPVSDAPAVAMPRQWELAQLEHRGRQAKREG